MEDSTIMTEVNDTSMAGDAEDNKTESVKVATSEDTEDGLDSNSNTDTSDHSRHSSGKDTSAEESMLRIDVSLSEIKCLDDSLMGCQDNSVEHDDAIDEKDDEEDSELNGYSSEPESKLHCFLCGNIFKDPRILDCLHTFCCDCLVSFIKANRDCTNKVTCPVCKAFTPGTNANKYQKDVIVQRLIENRNNGEVQAIPHCVVCSLHNESNEATGRCVDCGDLLCSGCCDKHTYSRLTANHSIVDLDHSSASHRNLISMCKAHDGEIGNSFCSKCNELVCKTCATTVHLSHKCSPVERVTKDLKNIYSSIEVLDLKLATLETTMNHTMETVLANIDKHGEDQFNILKKGRDKMVDMIDKSFQKHVNILKRLIHYQKKECSTRNRHIKSRRNDLQTLMDTVNFMFAEGTVPEISQMDKMLKSRLKAIERNINGAKDLKDLDSPKNMPKALVFDESWQKMKEMYFFSVHKSEKDAEKHTESLLTKSNQKAHISAPKGHNDVNHSKGVAGIPGLFGSQLGVKTAERTSLAQHLGQVGQVPVMNGLGRGGMLLNRDSSLLGEYVGPRGALGGHEAYSHPGFNMTGSPFSHISQESPKNQGLLMPVTEDQRVVRLHSELSTVKSTVTSIKLRSSINIQCPGDQRMPDVTDIVFTSLENFVACDTRNQILKAFSCAGQYLDYLQDPGPMSVTFCMGHLLWTSQMSTIKMYNTRNKEVTVIKKFSSTLPHPLTSFTNCQFERFLVGNVNGSEIGAYTIEGQHVLTIKPMDRSGKVLPYVVQIAAFMQDLIVLVDSRLKKVVVVNFDGCCMGEFSERGLEPTAVCVTETNQILLTDQAHDQIILLSAHAEYIRHWPAVVEKPMAIATNGNGVLIVGGRGKMVKVFQYTS